MRTTTPRLPRLRVGVPVAALAVVLLSAGPAAAHEGPGSTKAGDLVRQAIALIVNTPGDHDMIEDKIGDALTAKNTEGVDLTLVRQAQDALGAGDLHEVRALLEVSIGARPHPAGAALLPIRQTGGEPGYDEFATGSETGIDVTTDALHARRRLDAGTWAALAAMVAIAATGFGLAIRYRPPVPMRTLRRDAATPEVRP